MKKYISLILILTVGMLIFSGCKQNITDKTENTSNLSAAEQTVKSNDAFHTEGVKIELSDTQVLVDGIKASNDDTNAVYVANDIVYYEEGHDFTYGEGTEKDEHSKQEAEKHIVVHINKPGNYILTGKMSAGQIAVDLGKDSSQEPDAVVNLYLNGVDITNTVAPAVIFYNAYEPFYDVDEKTASKDVDTCAAGANVFVVDGSVNNISGSHVARIYKPESVVLSQDGKEVIEEKKLHKYDAAFYSKVTMNMNGGQKNTGVLNIKADNEGLDSEMHLTINGGIINIESGNDGINTNEDGVSVTTINGGALNIVVNGSSGEGDGIDSNGWLVINDGILTSQACGFSMDGGIDSDMGIHINGGTVIASGNMLDRISQSNQTYVVLNFSKFLGAGTYSLKNSDNDVVLEKEINNSFSSLIVSNDKLVQGDYTLWYNDTQLAGSMSENGGMFSGMPGFNMGKMPEGMTPPEGFEGKMPENMTPPEGFEGKTRPSMEENTAPDGFNGEKADFKKNQNNNFTPSDKDMQVPSHFEGKRPGGQRPDGNFAGNMPNQSVELSEIFSIKEGANYFSLIGIKE